MPATVNFFIELTPSAEAMAERIRQVATYKIPLAIKRGMDVSMPVIIDNIKTNRLSGKGPFPPSEHRLGEVTGLLKSSVSPLETTMDVSENSCTIDGGIQVTGVPYANIHEFGFIGDEDVPAHTRKYVRIRNPKRSASGFGPITGGLPSRTRSLLRRPVKTTTTSAVRAYTRKMNMPARAPFRTGMLENMVRIKQQIQTELGRALANI